MKMDFSKLIYDRIEKLIREKNYKSIFHFCKENNIPPTTIYSIKDKHINSTISLIVKICVALKISLSDFFDDEKFDIYVALDVIDRKTV